MTTRSVVMLALASRPVASSCSAAAAHSYRSSASWKLRPFRARCSAMRRGDGARSTAAVQGDERPGMITHPSRLTIAWYHPGTANNHAKLRRQPLRLESYWKRGAKYPLRINPLSLQSLGGSLNSGLTLFRISRNLCAIPLRQRQWMKSRHSSSSSPQPGPPLGNPSCLR